MNIYTFGHSVSFLNLFIVISSIQKFVSPSCQTLSYLREKIEYTGPLAKWVECSLMVRGTSVQLQAMSYQKLEKWYLIPPCLTLSVIRYGSRLKWSNQGKGVVPSPTLRCCSYWKGNLRVTLVHDQPTYFRRCPWCSRYRRRKWTRRHEFKSWTWLTAFHIALIPLGKVWIQLFSLQLWVNSRTD